MNEMEWGSGKRSDARERIEGRQSTNVKLEVKKVWSEKRVRENGLKTVNEIGIRSGEESRIKMQIAYMERGSAGEKVVQESGLKEKIEITMRK